MKTLTNAESRQALSRGLIAVVREWGEEAPESGPVYELTPDEVPGVQKVLQILEALRESLGRDANAAQVALTGLRLEREAFGPWELAVNAVAAEPVRDGWVRSGLTMTQEPAVNGEDHLLCRECEALLDEDAKATHFRADGKPVAALCRSCLEEVNEGRGHPVLRLALKTGTWEKPPETWGVDS